jgi:hypothetical protein
VFLVLGGGFKSHAVEAFLILLPAAMVAGFVPALVVAAFDNFFEKRSVRPLDRFIWIAVIGYGATYLLTLENLFETTPLIPFQYSWGLIGAVPAVFCSWLSRLTGDCP